MSNYGFISPFTMDSIYNPMTATSPFVKPDAAFPTLPIWSGDFQSSYMSAPSTDYYKMGQDYMANLNANSQLSSAAQGLASLEAEVKKTKESDQLKEEQKERLQEILDKIEALKAEISKAGNKSAEEKYALITKITELQEEAAQVAKEIAEEIQAEASDNSTDTTDPTSDTDSPSKPKTEKEKQELAYNMEKICDRIDRSVREAGTNYDDDDNGIKNILTKEINKDNVIELFEAWDKSYKGKGCYSGGDDEYGLIGTLMNDCEAGQKEEIAMLLINALYDKAREIGLDVASEVAAAKLASQGERHWYSVGIVTRNDDDICKAVNALYNKVKDGVEKYEKEQAEKIAAEEEKKKAEEAEEKAKAEEAKKQKETEAKDTFLGDMREIWKDDELEVSEKVKYEDGKFVIRIEGKEYSGKDFNELCDKICDAGYNPKDYLMKQPIVA